MTIFRKSLVALGLISSLLPSQNKRNSSITRPP